MKNWIRRKRNVSFTSVFESARVKTKIESVDLVTPDFIYIWNLSVYVLERFVCTLFFFRLASSRFTRREIRCRECKRCEKPKSDSRAHSLQHKTQFGGFYVCEFWWPRLRFRRIRVHAERKMLKFTESNKKCQNARRICTLYAHLTPQRIVSPSNVNNRMCLLFQRMHIDKFIRAISLAANRKSIMHSVFCFCYSLPESKRSSKHSLECALRLSRMTCNAIYINGIVHETNEPEMSRLKMWLPLTQGTQCAASGEWNRSGSAYPRTHCTKAGQKKKNVKMERENETSQN